MRMKSNNNDHDTHSPTTTASSTSSHEEEEENDDYSDQGSYEVDIHPTNNTTEDHEEVFLPLTGQEEETATTERGRSRFPNHQRADALPNGLRMAAMSTSLPLPPTRSVSPPPGNNKTRTQRQRQLSSSSHHSIFTSSTTTTTLDDCSALSQQVAWKFDKERARLARKEKDKIVLAPHERKGVVSVFTTTTTPPSNRQRSRSRSHDSTITFPLEEIVIPRSKMMRMRPSSLYQQDDDDDDEDGYSTCSSISSRSSKYRPQHARRQRPPKGEHSKEHPKTKSKSAPPIVVVVDQKKKPAWQLRLEANRAAPPTLPTRRGSSQEIVQDDEPQKQASPRQVEAKKAPTEAKKVPPPNHHQKVVMPLNDTIPSLFRAAAHDPFEKKTQEQQKNKNHRWKSLSQANEFITKVQKSVDETYLEEQFGSTGNKKPAWQMLRDERFQPGTGTGDDVVPVPIPHRKSSTTVHSSSNNNNILTSPLSSSQASLMGTTTLESCPSIDILQLQDPASDYDSDDNDDDSDHEDSLIEKALAAGDKQNKDEQQAILLPTGFVSASSLDVSLSTDCC